MLAFAVCGMVDGTRSIYALDRWGRRAAPPEVLAQLGMTRATPSVATLFRVLGGVDRPAFEAALLAWTRNQRMPASALFEPGAGHLRGLHGELLPGAHVAASDAAWLAGT